MSDGSTIWTRRTPRLKLKSLWKAIYYTFDEKQNYANNNNNILKEDQVKMIEYFKQQIFLWTISPNNVWIYWSAFAWDHILSNLCFVFHLGDLSEEKYGIIWEFFPYGVREVLFNPKTFVIWPSNFWHAKIILRC